MDGERAWYYADANGSPFGPHQRETLEGLRASGTILPGTLVWTEGMDDWAPYSDSPLQPKSAQHTAPPLPAQANASPLDMPTTADCPTEQQAGSHLPSSGPNNQLERLTPSSWRNRSEAAKTLGHGVWEAFRPSNLPPGSVVDDDGWQSTTPAPWRRYFARMLDTMIFGFLISAVMGVSMGVLDPQLFEKLYGKNGLFQNTLLATIFVLISAMPLEALVIGLTGTSIGKWIFGVRVTGTSGRPVGLTRAFGREVGAWFYGLGLGVPLVSLATLIVSYRRLKDDGATRWDKDHPWLVTYRPSGALQWVLSVSGFLCWLVLLVGLSVLGARS